MIEFPGYDYFVVGPEEEIPAGLPSRIKVTDTGRFADVDLDSMPLKGDAGRCTLQLRAKSRYLTRSTSEILFYVLLHALNGKRKVSTVMRWLNEFDLFTRSVASYTNGPIATITHGMFSWYCTDRSGSQQKLLRSMLKYWMELRVPGIAQNLQNYLAVSKAPKARSTIEIQNTTKHERPFSTEQVRRILSNIDDLYISGQFNPQENLVWRLIVSEAMRPSQMRLLQVGDVTINVDNPGRATLKVPIVKQKATPARRYMMEYRLSEPVSLAMAEHLAFLDKTLGHKPTATQPLFSIARSADGGSNMHKHELTIHALIQRTRKQIARDDDDLGSHDLFTRRFKHTKLTHLAMLGAPLEVLARAGFHTSTASLKHYVNLTEEAFLEYEELLSTHHTELLFAFKGRIVDRNDVTKSERFYTVQDMEMENDVGSCSASPCNVFAPVGCYICPRFEAFKDGPHELVLSFLMEKKEARKHMKLKPEALARDDHLISAVQQVIRKIDKMEQ